MQELIIQNFRAKKGTAMAAAAEPSLQELLWTVAMARIIMGPHANIQVWCSTSCNEWRRCSSWGLIQPVESHKFRPFLYADSN